MLQTDKNMPLSRIISGLPSRRGVGAPGPGEARVKAAVRLHGVFAAGNIRCLLVLPVSASTSTRSLLADMAKVLCRLSQAPVLLLDLHGGAEDASAASLLAGSESVNITDLASGNQVDFVPDTESPSILIARLGSEECDPLRFLSSEKFGSFLFKSRSRFSYLLIDGPSLGSSSASLLVAPRCDGCVLVVEDGVSVYAEMEETKKAIEQARGNLLGFVYQKREKRRGRVRG